MAHILLVDDDRQFRDMLKAMLERLDHKVVTAQDGNEALERYSELKPDLVITDLIMPEREGLETIRALTSGDADVRIIAMSGGGRSSPATFLKIARAMGAAAVLPKPFSFDQLSTAIETALLRR